MSKSLISFANTPYAGEKPLGVIAINVGVLTSAVSALALYPGERPFYFDPKELYAYVDGVGKGFPLHFYPPKTIWEIHGFHRPTMPRGRSPELALTKLLSSLRHEFDIALGDVALWATVKEHAQVLFTHPSAWKHQLDRIRGCIKDAGWLDGGRELIFKSEEEALVAHLYKSELQWSTSFCKDLVIVTESGPSAVAITRVAREVERRWVIRRRRRSETCPAGFAIAFDRASAKVSMFGAGYRLSYGRQQLEESSGAKSRGDIDVSESVADEVRSRSVALLVERLLDHLQPGPDIFFGGNYIGSEKVMALVMQLLKSRVRGVNGHCGPPPSFCRSNAMCLFYNSGAFYSYVFDNGLWKTVLRHQPESLKCGSLDFGNYDCCQYTPNGDPPDLSFLGLILEAGLEPPSPAVITHIDKIRDSARNCYIQTRLWKVAETSVPFLQPIVLKMRQFVDLYKVFLRQSLVASQSGHSVSAKCQTHPSTLGAGIPRNEFQETVRSLQSKVQEALVDATDVEVSLSSLRQIVTQIQDITNKTADSFDPSTLEDNTAYPTNDNPQLQTVVSFEQKLIITLPGIKEATLDVLRILETLEGAADEIAGWWEVAHSRVDRLAKNANCLSTSTPAKITFLHADWGAIGQSYTGLQDTLNSLLAITAMQYGSTVGESRPPDSQMELNLQEIRESAVKCYHQIRPWRHSKSSNALVARVVVKSMQQCFASYESFLQSSLTASESGYSASSKCETFFRHLANGYVPEEEQVADVKTTVMGALNTAEKMAESFRSVRVAIVKAQEFTSAMAEGLAQLNVPIDNVTLPLFDMENPLRSPTITGNPSLERGYHTTKVAPVSGTPQSSQTTESHLHQAIMTLDTFNNYINPIVNWWLEARSVLTDLEKKASQPKRSKLMAKLSTAKWETIKDEYVRYQMTVYPLLDPNVLVSV